MQHIDQKILELYVLNDETTVQQRETIEAHLAECAGCRELAARMEDMYSGFFATLEEEKKDNSSASVPARIKKSLIQQTASPLQEIRANYEIERSPIRRVAYFAKQHPIVSSTMSLFVVGFFALLGLQLFSATENVDDNPSYYRYSPDNKLEVYNKNNELLWSAPSDELEETRKQEHQHISKRTLITDINNDGKNEILTTLVFSGEGNKSPTLKVYSSAGNALTEYSIPDTSLNFRNIHYDVNFSFSFISTFKTSAEQENILATVGCGRSPIFLARFDKQLNLIGTYWHFGTISPIQIDLNNDGVKEIILGGRNDIDDDKNRDFAFLTLLNPENIVGNVEASDTRGFGLPTSKAEIATIRFPISSIEKIEMFRALPRTIAFENEELFSLQLNVSSDDNAIEFFGFTYSFKKSDLSVIDIKYNTATARVFDNLKKQGKIKGTFDKAYLDNLKKGVEYWDGDRWVKKPTLILHPPITLGAK